MQQEITIIMYHYVRELAQTPYPSINALLTSEFKSQLEFLRKNYNFVTIQDCINAIYHQMVLPPNPCLLTFDDGYIDHLINVFPLLNQYKIQGSFFPPAKAVLEHRLLDVNKIHFLLASMNDRIDQLIKQIFLLLDNYREQYKLKSNDFYSKKFSQQRFFDSPKVSFVKQMLQFELPTELRSAILDELFLTFVTSDETSFAKELYLDIDQIKYMANNNMYIGGHGYRHYWLNKLNENEQMHEIDKTIKFLKKINSPLKNWVMCYPYGGYDQSLIQILNKKGCSMALTSINNSHNGKNYRAILSPDHAYELTRFDTNEFPPKTKGD